MAWSRFTVLIGPGANVFLRRIFETVDSVPKHTRGTGSAREIPIGRFADYSGVAGTRVA